MARRRWRYDISRARKSTRCAASRTHACSSMRAIRRNRARTSSRRHGGRRSRDAVASHFNRWPNPNFEERSVKFSIVLAVSVTLWAAISVAAPVSPYAGEEAREIKALSTEERKSYLSGEGMGLARPAELNGYPGPSHVLALGADL